MASRQIILYCGATDRPPPELVSRWAASRGFTLEQHSRPADVEASVLRGRGSMVFVDDAPGQPAAIEPVRRLKADPFTEYQVLADVMGSAKNMGMTKIGFESFTAAN